MSKKIILGISGEISSGKTSLANYLVDNYQASSYKFSNVLRDIADRIYIPKNRQNLQKISTILRQNFSDNILSEIIYKDIKKNTNKIIVIDGVRRFSDIDNLKNLVGFKLIYIEADIKIRYKRIIKRNENTDDKNKKFTDFIKDHQREAEKEIKLLKDKADYIINNNKSFKNFYSQIDNYINKIRIK